MFSSNQEWDAPLASAPRDVDLLLSNPKPSIIFTYCTTLQPMREVGVEISKYSQ